MDQEEVFAAVKGERDYQDALAKKFNWGNGTGVANNHEVGVFVALLFDYVLRASAAHTDATGYRAPIGNETTLDIIRKIAAIAVACMEKHGVPARDQTLPDAFQE